jgi:hypothetical protein
VEAGNERLAPASEGEAEDPGRTRAADIVRHPRRLVRGGPRPMSLDLWGSRVGSSSGVSKMVPGGPRCASWGAPRSSDARFCARCGHELRQEPVPPKTSDLTAGKPASMASGTGSDASGTVESLSEPSLAWPTSSGSSKESSTPGMSKPTSTSEGHPDRAELNLPTIQQRVRTPSRATQPSPRPAIKARKVTTRGQCLRRRRRPHQITDASASRRTAPLQGKPVTPAANAVRDGPLCLPLPASSTMEVVRSRPGHRAAQERWSGVRG